ncbi:MAG TPA: DUF2780 domain-containing protein, partial [Dehalococcoidales bacterium]|nr:DUF2780 domain-containing protein [Dehalococcoidales bacterium]
MKKYKKVIIIAAIAVVVLGASLGAVAFAQADTKAPSTTANTTFNKTSLYDTVASILNQAKGTNITGADLQSAFQQAEKQAADTALDNMLQKLVTDGKITQQQATDYKNWLNSRPTQMMSDQYKQWLESRPNIPGLPGAAPKIPAISGNSTTPGKFPAV